MEGALRDAFARVEWRGPLPDVPAGASVVLYANHHTFFDGYLGWLVLRRVLDHAPLTWMRDWDRFPFFAAVGALPFPETDAAERAATVRRTARRFASGSPHGLVYFPEGTLHAPEEGVAPFDAAFLARLDRLLPRKVWLPLAITVTMQEGARPVCRLAAGTPHPAIRGDEHDRLTALLATLRQAPPPETRRLLDGRPSPAERWSFRFTRRYFRRFL